MKKALPKTFAGKSTAKGMGGRAAMMKSALEKKGLPAKEIGGIIGKQARKTQTAPGQKFYKGGKDTTPDKTESKARKMKEKKMGMKS